MLRRVVGDEAIEVTDHGHAIAWIVPLRPGVLDQLVLEGRATEADGDLLDIADELGLPVGAAPATLARSCLGGAAAHRDGARTPATGQ